MVDREGRTESNTRRPNTLGNIDGLDIPHNASMVAESSGVEA